MQELSMSSCLLFWIKFFLPQWKVSGNSSPFALFDDVLRMTTVKPCSHVDKGVSLNAVKKGIKNAGGSTKLGQCQVCFGDNLKQSGKSKSKSGEDGMQQAPLAETDEITDGLEPSVWLCLLCGNQGCGRSSVNKHAIKHYETPRSGSHNLAVCVTNWQIWCYKCDDEVAPDESKKLQECVDWVRKEMGIGKTAASDKNIIKKSQESEGESTPTKGLFKGSANPGKADGQLIRVKGLTNLGNTCFFNAVMQSLTQTHVLRSVMLEKCQTGREITIPDDTHVQMSLENGAGGAVIKKREGEEDEEEEEDDDDDMCNQPLFPRKITLSSSGNLTSSLVNFLDEMNKQSKGSNINPRALFNQICQKAPRFKGYQQQDSHELLRYLMDGMKAEEIKRVQEGILSAFDYNPKKTKNVPDNKKKQIKAYGQQSKHTFVDTVFGGHLISSVTCHECHTISEVLEPFLDLSLPIIEAKGEFSRRQKMLKSSGNKKNVHASKSLDKAPPGLLEKSADNSNKQETDEPVTRKEDKPSKYQQKKALEKQRKDSKKKLKNRGRSNSATTAAVESGSQQDTPVHSDSEDRREGGDGHMYDADSETSLFDRPGVSNNKFDVLARLENTHLGDAGQLRRGSAPSETNNIRGQSNVEEGERTQAVFQKVGQKGTPRGDNIKEAVNKFAAMSLNDKDSEQSSTTSPENSSGSRSGMKDGKRFITTATCENGDIVGDNDSGNDTDKETNKKFLDDSDEETNTKLGPEPPQELLNHMDAKDGDSDGDTNTNMLNKRQVRSNFVKGKIANFLKGESNDDATTTATTTNTKSPLPTLDKEATKLNEAAGGTPAVIPTSISPPPVAVNHNSVSPPLSPRTKATTALTSRYIAKHMECSVQSCLSQFTAPEWLTGANRFGCETCAKRQGTDDKKKPKVVYTDASKQLLIHQPPPIITLHLKRFGQVGYTLRKITRHIDFPLILDIAPFCSSGCKRFADEDNCVRYSLYGVVEHSGRLQFGHYTAFVKARHSSEALHKFAMSMPQSLNTVKQRKKSWQQQETTTTTTSSVPNGSIANHMPNGIGEHNPQTNNLSTSLQNNLANVSDYSNVIRPQGPTVIPPEGKWYYVSDTHVTESQESKVLNAQAYLLFYERLL